MIYTKKTRNFRGFFDDKKQMKNLFEILNIFFKNAFTFLKNIICLYSILIYCILIYSIRNIFKEAPANG